jgi:hypothetical protein
MRTISTFLFLCVVVSSVARAEESKSDTKVAPDEIVKSGILRFHEQMRSADVKIREKAFDDVLADKKLLEKLLGEDANLVWPRIAETIPRMRSSTDKGKEQLDRQGDIKSVEVIDLRKSDSLGRFTRVLEVIPKDIPVYRAVIKFENATGGMSSYLVVDGRMRFVQGLETLPDLIDREKKAKP